MNKFKEWLIQLKQQMVANKMNHQIAANQNKLLINTNKNANKYFNFK